MTRFLKLPLRQKFPGFFAILIFLTVAAPHPDLYKAFFHLVIAPSVVLLLIRRETGIDWQDPLLRLALFLAAYASITTFFVSNATLREDLRAFRWGVEASFFVLALFIAMRDLMVSPAYWGRIFQWVAILGSAIALISFYFLADMEGRLGGLGALGNPILAASVLMVYWALGAFILIHGSPGVLGRSDMILIVLALALVVLVCLLTESRGPVVALAVYLSFFSVVALFYGRTRQMLWVVPVVVVLVLALLHGIYGLEDYWEAMLVRGASYRLEIWSAIIEYPPDSLLFGDGSGTSPMNTMAGREVYFPMGLNVSHAHNLFLGTFAETGLIGLISLLGLLGLILWRVVRMRASGSERLHQLGLFGLVMMLCVTDTHTLIISVKAAWFYTWLPLIFIWFWSVRPVVPAWISAPEAK